MHIQQLISDDYDFLGKIAVADDLSSFETATADHCGKRFDVQSIIAVRFHRNARPNVLFRWIPDPDLRRFFDQNYTDFGYLLDPFHQRAWGTQSLEVHRLRDIAPDRFEASEYVASYFQGTRMVDEMGFVIRGDEDTSLHFSLGRNVGGRRIRRSELDQFRLLSKVLAPKLGALAHQEQAIPELHDPTLKDRYFAIAQQDDTPISKRESEVAALVVQGHSSRSIGLILGISRQTVKVHRRTLYRKLNISSQSQLFGLLTDRGNLKS
ncbi:MAG: helix-turn-helix transcriptional regulator [Octadecabacter sp.]